MKTRWIAALAVAILGAPFWLWYGHKGLYQAACAWGRPGAHVLEPFTVDAFVLGSGDPMPWTSGPWFVTECGRLCAADLNHITFDMFRPWSGGLESGVPIEQAWDLPRYGNARKSVRLWTAAPGSPECIAPLEHPWGGRPRCIAAREIEQVSARFRIVGGPFRHAVDYTDGKHLDPTSLEWRRLGVEKHQQHLEKDGRLVARYVWYERNAVPGLFQSETCPANATSVLPGQGMRAFWDRMLDPHGVTN